jgi:hypothetical protein
MLRSTGGPGPGDIVTCPNGHELYRVVRHLQRLTPIRADAFESIDPRMPAPESANIIPKCHCGKTIFARGAMHFRGHGWWPSSPPPSAGTAMDPQ